MNSNPKKSQWRLVDLFSFSSKSFLLRFFPPQPIYRTLEDLPETTSSKSIAPRESLIILLSLSNGPEPTAVELAIAAPKTLAVEGTFICFFDLKSFFVLSIQKTHIVPKDMIYSLMIISALFEKNWPFSVCSLINLVRSFVDSSDTPTQFTIRKLFSFYFIFSLTSQCLCTFV